MRLSSYPSPFGGNAVFINRSLHDQAALQEIIRHEFIHIKQRHTADMLWTEFLCPRQLVQSLRLAAEKRSARTWEFIADNKVLENGVFPEKEYQYLLLGERDRQPSIQYSHIRLISSPKTYSHDEQKRPTAVTGGCCSSTCHRYRYWPSAAKLMEVNGKAAPAERKVMLAGTVRMPIPKATARRFPDPLPGAEPGCANRRQRYYRSDLDIGKQTPGFQHAASKPGYDGLQPVRELG